MYCVLAPAEDTTYLYAYAKIDDISITKKGTICRLSCVKRFPYNKIKKCMLKKINGSNIPENYIRPYVLCNINPIDKEIQKQNANHKRKDTVIKAPEKKEIITTAYKRSARIKKLVLARAHKRCELCNKASPFIDMKGSPYFEMHHLIPLSEGGLDTVDNVVCLCPNCHRELHFGKKSKRYRKMLIVKLREKK